MKNIMKKLFSLLLVGVVAVSMFGFIAPNSVDAKEEKPSKGEVHLKQCAMWDFFYTDGEYIVKFYGASGNVISTPSTKLGCMIHTEHTFPIPVETKSAVVTVKKVIPFTGKYVVVDRLKFELNEKSTSSTGVISVEGHGANQSANVAQRTTGCWKYAGKIN